MASKPVGNVHERVAEHGSRLDALGDRISGLETEMHAGFARVGRQLEQLAATLAARAAPNWGVLFAAGGLILSFVIAIAAVMWQPVAIYQRQLEGTDREIWAAIKEDRTRYNALVTESRAERMELKTDIVRLEEAAKARKP